MISSALFSKVVSPLWALVYIR